MSTVNLSTVTNTITKQYVSIQAIAESKPCGFVFTSAEQEIDYMVAGGKTRVWLQDMATHLAGALIAKIDDVTEEYEVILSPNKQKDATNKDLPVKVTQSLNNSLKMVASHLFLLSGHANALAIESALNNWIATDNVRVELDTNDIALKLLAAMLRADLIEHGYADGENGGTFETYGLVDKWQQLRLTTIQQLWDKAPPRMKPMQFPVRWLHDGTCQLPNFRLMNGKSVFNAEFVESFNLMGHTGYVVNQQMQDLLLDWFESVEEPDVTNLTPSAATQAKDKHKDLKNTVEQLTMLPLGIKIFFPHTSDWRGRAYARGGLTQFQSVKECRAMFDFAEHVDITDPTGLFLHVANAHGVDKLSINARIAWVKTNTQQILETVEANEVPQSGGEFYERRAAIALKEYLDTGATNIICHIDGTCNGTQWTAAMYRDENTAKYVNVRKASHDDVPLDLYGKVATVACTLVTGDVLRVLEQYHRDIAKPVVMVLGYGASEDTLLREVRDFLAAKGDNGDAKAVTEALVTAIELAAPALTKLTRNLKMQLKRKPRHEASWCVPDLKVKTCNLNTDHLTLYSSQYGGKLQGKAKPDAKAFARGISPNYVHSLDSAHLRAVVRNASCRLSCIHDSIGAPANKVVEVNELIRVEFHKLNQMDLVSNIYTQLELRYRKNLGKLDIDEVLEASYIFS